MTVTTSRPRFKNLYNDDVVKMIMGCRITLTML